MPSSHGSLFRRGKIFGLLSVFIVSSFASILSPLTTYALDGEETFKSYNNILFYKKGGDCFSKEDTAGTGVSADPSTIPIVKSDNLETIYKKLASYGFNNGQVAAIMGNFYVESAGAFKGDIEEDNKMGYGIAQWSLTRRTDLEAYAKSKGVAVSDLTMQLDFLNKEYNDTFKSQLAATAFGDGVDIKAATRAWMDVFENPYIDPSSSDPAKINSGRIPAALKIDQLYGATAAAKPSGSCQDKTSGVVGGDMVKTAIGLALETPINDTDSAAGTKVNKSDARDTYQAAKEKYNPANSAGIPSYSDCGGFVATVMISSGVDPGYPKSGVSIQMGYVENNPSKYAVFTNFTQVGQLQPGDIMYVDNDSYSHTTIFTGAATYPSADASLNQRVPSVRPGSSATWMLGQHATVARIIK